MLRAFESRFLIAGSDLANQRSIFLGGEWLPDLSGMDKMPACPFVFMTSRRSSMRGAAPTTSTTPTFVFLPALHGDNFECNLLNNGSFSSQFCPLKYETVANFYAPHY